MPRIALQKSPSAENFPWNKIISYFRHSVSLFAPFQ